MKDNLRYIIIGAAIVLAVVIYAFSTRYSYYPSRNMRIDHWTGKVDHP